MTVDLEVSQTRRDEKAQAVDEKKVRPEPQHIFVVAKQYENARERLILVQDHGPQADVRMPTITCAAFALELYLKCLLALDARDVPQTHNLRCLFDGLSEATQAEIRERVEPRLPEARRYVGEAYAKSGLAPPPPLVDFDFLLDSSEDAFPLVRYIYERGLPAGKGWIADPILEAARTTILARHPAWSEAVQAKPIPIIGVRSAT